MRRAFLGVALAYAFVAAPIQAAPRPDPYALHASLMPTVYTPFMTSLLFQPVGGVAFYREDSAHASGQIGLFILGVRNDAGTTLCGTDGDYCSFQLDATGALRVTGGGGGTQYDEDTPTAAAEKLTMAGVVRQDAPVSLVGTDQDRTSLSVDASGRLWTNPSGVTTPISAASLPLPTGAATSANQTTVIGHVDGIEGLLTTIDADTGTLAGAVSGTEVQVDVVTSALPTGAATLAEQQTQTTALQVIDNLPVAQGSTTSGQSGALVQGAVTTGDPTYTTGQTSPLSLTTDGKLRVAGSFSGGGDGAIQDGATPSIEATVFDFTNSNPLGVVLRDTNGDYVSVGGGTQYNQGTAGTSTDTLTMAGAVRKDTAAVDAGVADGDRLVLSTDAVGRLRTTSADTTQPVSGTVTANAGSGTFTVAGTVTANAGTGTFATDPTDEDARVLGRVKIHDGTDTALVSAAGALLTDASATTQPISAASLPLPTGAATAANQDGIVKDGTGDTTQANVSGGRMHVDGSGVTQPVSGTVTANAGTGPFPVSDNAGSLTVDAPLGTPVHVRPSDGTNAANVTAAGGLNVNLRNNAGTEVGTSTLPLQVDLNTINSSSTTGTFDSDEDVILRFVYQASGQATAFTLNAGTLAATILPECSADLGTTYRTGWFLNPTSLALSQSLVVTNPNAQTTLGILCPGGTFYARARVDSYTSGTATVALAVSSSQGLTTFANLRKATGAELAPAEGLAQGSTTSGQLGPLVQGAVSTSDPSYTNGQTSPLSLTTAGMARVSGSMVLSPVSASSVVAALNDATTLATSGYGAGGFQLVGTCTTGVVTFEGTVDGTNWSALEVWPIGSQTSVTTAAAAGIWTASVGGLASVRARVSDACDANNFTASLRATGATPRMFSAPGSGGDGAILDGATPSIEATVFDFTNSNPLGVVLRDTNGDYVSVGGGTQYNQGTATTDTDTLTMAGAVRRDTAAVATGVVDGDRVVFSTDNVGRLRTTAADTTQPILAASLPLPTGASTLAEQQTQTTALQIIDNLPVAQGSTTSGQQGLLAQGAVTTGDPSYTTGQTSPLSLDTFGHVRTTGVVFGPELDGSPATGAPVRIGGKDGGGNTQDILTDTDGNLQVDILTAPTITVTDGAGAMNVIVDSGSITASDPSYTDATGGTVPANAAFVAGTDGTNTRALKTDSGGELQVDVLTVPTVTVTDGAEAMNVIVDSITAGDNNIGNVDVVTLPNVTVGTFPDNEPINVAQVGGVAIVADPCMREARIPISISQTGNVQLITGTASERIFICSMHIVTATAQNVALVSGTGTVCDTSPSGVVGFGGATAATGWNFAANGGIQMAPSNWSYGKTDTDADNVCLFQSGSGQLSGGLTYVSAANF